MKVDENTKANYKRAIEKANSETEVIELFAQIEKLDSDIKIQVKYKVKYQDENNAAVTYDDTKISFIGYEVKEKAKDISGYELISQKEQTLVVSANLQEIVFKYKKIDVDALNELRAELIQKIDELKRVSDRVKSEYKELVSSSKSVEEAKSIFEEISKIDADTKVQIKYQIKFVDINGLEIEKPITKIDFAGKEVTENPKDIEKYIKPTEPKTIVLEEGKENAVVFVYEKTDEVKTLKEFLSERIDLTKPLTYSDTNFANRPEELKEYVIKAIYKRQLAISFYATDEDLEYLYWNLWNKPTDASLVRIARLWTDKSNAKKLDFDTGIPGVYKYGIAITYDIQPKQLMDAEAEIDRIIEKYDVRSMTDFQKAKFIYDYLIKTSAVNQDNNLGYSRYNHSGVLLAKAGVCEGYALAYSRIAERAGLDSRFVSGFYFPEWYGKQYPHHIKARLDQMNTEVFDKKLNHAWNQVKIDGVWYHVDSYHGDYYHTINGNELIFATFLKSDKTIGKDRIWNYNFTHNAPKDYNDKNNFKVDENNIIQ